MQQINCFISMTFFFIIVIEFEIAIFAMEKPFMLLFRVGF